MSKHTPGPWHTEALPSSDLHFIRGVYSDDAGQIAKVRVGPVLEQDEALANAKLLAAAPELLAALEVALFEVQGFERRTGIPQFSPWIQTTRELIAKVKQ